MHQTQAPTYTKAIMLQSLSSSGGSLYEDDESEANYIEGAGSSVGTPRGLMSNLPQSPNNGAINFKDA